jgi:DnaJ-class molecular chaperone
MGGEDESKTARPGMNPGDEVRADTPQSGEAICPDCGGAGRIAVGKCPTCNGTGKVIALVGEA